MTDDKDFNPYEILGVNEKATTDEIKAARNAKIKLVHSDVSGDMSDNPMVSKINLAYGILSNEYKRGMYDQSGSVETLEFEAKIKACKSDAKGRVLTMFKALIISGAITSNNISLAKGSIIRDLAKARMKEDIVIKNNRGVIRRALATVNHALKAYKKGKDFPEYLHDALTEEASRLRGELEKCTIQSKFYPFCMLEAHKLSFEDYKEEHADGIVPIMIS